MDNRKVTKSSAFVQINEEKLNQIVEDLRVQDDTKAKKELKQLEGDSKRVEEFKQATHGIFIVIVRFLFALGVVIITVRVYHLLMPTQCQWLTEIQINNLDKILFSGTIGGFVGKYFKGMFSNTTNYSNGG